jgi:hypothetical protein
MTVSARFTDEESAAWARYWYATPEYAKTWRTYKLAGMFGALLSALAFVAFLPWLVASFLLVLAGVAGYSLGKLAQVCFTRIGTRRFVRQMAEAKPCTYHFQPDGIGYRSEDMEVKCAWTLVKEVTETHEDFLVLSVGDQTWTIPPGAFHSPQQRIDLLKIIEAARAGTQPAETWWTQGSAVTKADEEQVRNTRS